MSAKATVLLEHCLKTLKLPTMLRDYRKLATLCSTERSDYAGYLLKLCERELHEREERRLGRFVKQLGRLDLLVLDELGYVPFSKTGAELLYEVVSQSYERTSLIVTTNLPFEAWVEVMGSERLTGAMLDRLTHRVHILEANGESFRLRETKRRRKRQNTTR
jgi:hypothetical protein